ncbi:PDZ domain-containing protein [bacterium]|nr:PDZ domain-containing protein [bacterium]
MTNRAISLSLLTGLLAFSLGFAGDHVASEKAKEMLALAKAEMKANTGAFLGVVPEEVTSDVAGDYGVAAGQGVLIEETVSGSPADDAGLRANDILVSINGNRLTGPSELRVQLDKYKEGDEVTIAYMRGGKERTATVKLDSRNRGEDFDWSWGEAAPMAPKMFKFESRDGSKSAFAGIVTQELSSGLKSYFKVEGGALVSEVVEKSPAEKAGLKAGDIITKIGTESVEDQSDVSSAIRDLDPDQTVDFHIIREGKAMVIPVTLTNRKDFYGDASDGESWEFAFSEKDAEQLEAEMERLSEELENMGIELESIPDIKWEMKMDADHPKVYIGSGESRAITSDRGWWNWSFKDLRERIDLGMQELKKDLERLKGELKQLRAEIKDRMSIMWGPRIDVAPQA